VKTQPLAPPDVLRRLAAFFQVQHEFNAQCCRILEIFDIDVDADVRRNVAGILEHSVSASLFDIEDVWVLIDDQLRPDFGDEPHLPVRERGARPRLAFTNPRHMKGKPND
jgi:hypothetical protein